MCRAPKAANVRHPATGFYWLAMGPTFYLTVRNCVSCARELLKFRLVSKALNLFPATGPLQDVSLDIFDEFIATSTGFKDLLVITSR